MVPRTPAHEQGLTCALRVRVARLHPWDRPRRPDIWPRPGPARIRRYRGMEIARNAWQHQHRFQPRRTVSCAHATVVSLDRVNVVLPVLLR